MKEVKQGRFRLYLPYESIEPQALINAFLNADVMEGKGRGAIKILSIGDKSIVCRKYLHGGLFRGITKDYFFSGKRAIKELEIIEYLKNAGFPVIEPFCAMVEMHAVTKYPYLFTVLEKDALSLLNYFSKASGKLRLKKIRELAGYMHDLEKLGIYHPDLHLDNILITKEDSMKFLDFDRACRKSITKEDMENMFRRLNRYTDKMERKGLTDVSVKEKMFFLRCYERVSGYDMLTRMQKHIKLKRLFEKTGWFLDSLLYGSSKKKIEAGHT